MFIMKFFNLKKIYCLLNKNEMNILFSLYFIVMNHSTNKRRSDYYNLQTNATFIFFHFIKERSGDNIKITLAFVITTS